MKPKRWLAAVIDDEESLPNSATQVEMLLAMTEYVSEHVDAPPPELNVYENSLTLSWHLRIHHRGSEALAVRKILRTYGTQDWTMHPAGNHLRSQRIVGKHTVILFVHLPPDFTGKDSVMREFGWS